MAVTKIKELQNPNMVVEKVKELKFKPKIEIEISRKNGKTFLEFKIDPTIEELFAKQAQEERDSKAWAGLRFYYIPALIQSSQYKNILQKYGLIDDFGAELYSANHFNIAFIRTVGGIGKIEVPGDIPFAIVSVGIKQVVSFLKEYYENFLKDYSVKGVVSFEV